VIVIGDTSGLVAALNTSEPEHEPARTAMRQAALTVVSPLVILEIEHITTRNIHRRAFVSTIPASTRVGGDDTGDSKLERRSSTMHACICMQTVSGNC
jgi:predicted nucleic acid-binding protein